MIKDFQFKDNYNVDDLVKIMEILRSENGCPWDKEQTHDSIRNNFLEEVYEVVDAIDRDDKTDLKEELGDVLLQVLFHAQIASEEGRFTMKEVVDGLAKKMVRRHPHVFGDVPAAVSPEEGLANWKAMKEKEKEEKKKRAENS